MPAPLPDDVVLAALQSVFPCAWRLHYNGPNEHEAVQGLGPLSIHVALDDCAGGHWSASTGADGDNGLAWAYPGGAMAEPAELAERGIAPGSLEELLEVLDALRFNAGQAAAEVVAALQSLTGAPHRYRSTPGLRALRVRDRHEHRRTRMAALERLRVVAGQEASND